MSNPTGGLMEYAIKRVCRIAGVNVLVTAHYERLREQINIPAANKKEGADNSFLKRTI